MKLSKIIVLFVCMVSMPALLLPSSAHNERDAKPKYQSWIKPLLFPAFCAGAAVVAAGITLADKSGQRGLENFSGTCSCKGTLAVAGFSFAITIEKGISAVTAPSLSSRREAKANADLKHSRESSAPHASAPPMPEEVRNHKGTKFYSSKLNQWVIFTSSTHN